MATILRSLLFTPANRVAAFDKALAKLSGRGWRQGPNPWRQD
jgi:hypothetical protein